MNKQTQMIDELIRIKNENPELEILTMTHYEVVCEDWGYWRGEISEVKKDIYFQDDEKMYFGADGIYEQLSDSASLEPEFEDMDDDDFKIMIENEIELKKQSGEIKEAIIIYIGV